MKILVLNCGGATLKYKLYEMPAERIVSQGTIDRLGTPEAVLKFRTGDGASRSLPVTAPDHLRGMRRVFDLIITPEGGGLTDLHDLDAIGHKLAHGGEQLTGAVAIDDRVLQIMRDVAPLVPVHNPPNITGIEACRTLLPEIPQFGTFETSFHLTVPSYAQTYGLPYQWQEQFHVRGFGFHSCSHRYVSGHVAEMLGRPVEELRIVSCHLGSGTSVCAIRYGESFDISSGLTPQSGTIMSTRPGDFDPCAVTHVMRQLQISPDEMDRLLTKESGLLGISGVSGDVRDLREAAAAGNARARLALDVFCYQVRRYVGAYIYLMGGVDVITFAGGIGENDAEVRAAVCAGADFLGLKLDAKKNSCCDGEGFIHAADSRIAAAVVRTDEEVIVVRDAYRLLTAGNR